MVEYPANGEASDWMLGKRGIYAMSPELGTSDKASETFFIETRDTVKKVVSENYPWIKYTMLKVLPSISVRVTNLYEPRRRYLNSTSLALNLQIDKNAMKFGHLSEAAPVHCHQVSLFELLPDLEIESIKFPEPENHFKIDDFMIYNHTTFFELKE